MNQHPQLLKAMQALQAAIPLALADPARPVFHFCPPAQWMNDINGPLFHRGFNHIFYQHNPFSDMPMGERLAHMHWGHARSSDLVSWEHFPIALLPSPETGEKSCWSGCTAIDGRGRPIIIYTAVFEDEMPFQKPFEQWLALGDDKLATWNKDPHNPLLSLAKTAAGGLSPEWRDPFLFKAANRTFMIFGAGGEGGVPLFESCDDALARWAYVGRLLHENVECPNFFPLGDSWVCIYSPFDLVRYLVGPFHPDNAGFSPENGGVVDWGHFYGANIIVDDAGRCILLGWIPGWNWDLFHAGRGWNGCMSLPRVLGLTPDKRLLQKPVPELQKLRLAEGHVRIVDTEVNDSRRLLHNSPDDACELVLEVTRISAGECSIGLHSEGRETILLCYSPVDRRLQIADAVIPLYTGRQENFKLHIFVDRSIIEIYVNDGEAAISRMENHALGKWQIEIAARGGGALASLLEIWKLKPAEFRHHPAAHSGRDNVSL